MLQKQELDAKKNSIYFELITDDDPRYEEKRKEYPANSPTEPNPVLPIIKIDVDSENMSPLISARISEQFDDYMDDNPDIMHKILTCNEENILESFPYQEPHTEDIKVCDLILLGSDETSVLFEFDFDNLISICS